FLEPVRKRAGLDLAALTAVRSREFSTTSFIKDSSFWRRHGTGLRYLRQGSAVWEQYFARAQHHEAALECESASGEGEGGRRSEAAARVQQLSEGWEGNEG